MSDLSSKELVTLLRDAHNYIYSMEWKSDGDHAKAQRICSALSRAIWQQPDEPAETHPMLTVLTICDAYESGMGQGLARREFRNPYDPVNDPHAYRAYGHGYDEGVKRRAAQPPSAWQPIETAPHDREVLFWVVPLSADETYRDTSGNPITSGEKPRMMFCRFGRWSSLSKATHWADVPTGCPSETKGESHG